MASSHEQRLRPTKELSVSITIQPAADDRGRSAADFTAGMSPVFAGFSAVGRVSTLLAPAGLLSMNSLLRTHSLFLNADAKVSPTPPEGEGRGKTSGRQDTPGLPLEDSQPNDRRANPADSRDAPG